VAFSENDRSAGRRGLRFRQFRLFHEGRFGALSARQACPFQPRNGYRYWQISLSTKLITAGHAGHFFPSGRQPGPSGSGASHNAVYGE
jgi:hypothetical protein